MERFFSNIMSNWGKFSAIIELGRPWNGTIVGLLSILGTILAFQSIPSLFLMLTAFIVTFVIYMAATILNDVYDVKVDKVNMPYRPLQKGKINIGNAFSFSMFFYIVGMFLSLLLSINFFISILFMSVLSILYSLPPMSAKNRPFIGNIFLGVNMIFTAIYSGFVLITNNLLPDIKFLSSVGLMTLAFVLMCLIKDFKDIQGDKMYGKRTAAATYNKKLIVFLIGLGSLIMLFSMMIFNYYYFNNIIFVVLSIIFFIPLLLIDIKTFNKKAEEFGEKAWGLKRLVVLFFLLNIIIFSLITFY